MKKSTVLMGSLALISSTLLAALPVQAADYTSKGAITFEADATPTDPVDPLDPSTPVVPTDPVNPDGPNPGTPGPLSLDFASSFQFGVQKITTADQEYYAQPQKYTRDGKATEGPNYIQITDKRGNAEGWSLAVKQEKQFATVETAVNGNTPAGTPLDGAQLSFENAAAVSEVSADYAPTINNGGTAFSLVPGTQATLMTAGNGKGMGTWLYRLGDDQTAGKSVKLDIPGKSVKLAKQYTTTLTWTLAATPENQ